MNQQYVTQRDGGYWITDSRVSLDSVVRAFHEGLSPETIATECFPSLTLEQVYGAVTFYLNQQMEIDAYLATDEKLEDEFRAQIRARYPQIARRIDNLKSRETVSS